MAKILIRSARLEDDAAIYELTKAAFAPMPFAGGNEQDLPRAMRVAGALALSLVAEHDGIVVGHVAFSPATNDDGSGGWYALGPISVAPALQRQGIGERLIAEGLARLRGLDARGCILTGDPAYYARHGFEPCPQCAPEAEPAEYFMVRLLHGALPAARFQFHPVFYAGA